MRIPILRTKRLILRPHACEDFAACARMWADPAVTRYIGGQPSTAAQAWTRLLAYRGHWELMGYGYWAVEERSTGRFVGELGFADFKRDLKPALKIVPEMGWVFVPSRHGRGYATEAVRAAAAWGDSHFGKRRVHCLIDPGNQASAHVALKCGFRKLRPAVHKGAPTVVFVRSARAAGIAPILAKITA
ncbi:MAG: GNAT family N-acetyltransferase [Elusimicrobiota bacterium]